VHCTSHEPLTTLFLDDMTQDSVRSVICNHGNGKSIPSPYGRLLWLFLKQASNLRHLLSVDVDNHKVLVKYIFPGVVGLWGDHLLFTGKLHAGQQNSSLLVTTSNKSNPPGAPHPLEMDRQQPIHKETTAERHEENYCPGHVHGCLLNLPGHHFTPKIPTLIHNFC